MEQFLKIANRLVKASASNINKQCLKDSASIQKLYISFSDASTSIHIPTLKNPATSGYYQLYIDICIYVVSVIQRYLFKIYLYIFEADPFKKYLNLKFSPRLSVISNLWRCETCVTEMYDGVGVQVFGCNLSE